MLEKKQLRLLVIVLAITNVLTLTLYLTRSDSNSEKETVATIGDETITRQEWLNELEANYGEETLRNLIDGEVIEQMAEQYDMTISKKTLEQEMNIYKVLYGTPGQALSDTEWEDQVKQSILLEELLTKDVVIPEEDLKAFYQKNNDLFHLPTSYHISQIIVKTKKEAEQTIKELEQGSSFSALANERSLDGFSANLGGDIGFISGKEENVEKALLAEVENMKQQTW